MSLIEELIGTVSEIVVEADELTIFLSGAMERIETLVQLQATDLDLTANDDAKAMIANIHATHRNLLATVASLVAVEERAQSYLNYLKGSGQI